MNISQAAQNSGLSAKTIRYYEQIELVKPARREENGYRSYNQTDLAELRFLHRARDVGFSLDECRQLLSILRDPVRQSAHVKSLVLEKCEQIQQRVSQLESMHAMLRALASQCSGDEGPDCAILDVLAREEGADV